MAKVGSIFREARLERGLTLEQISDETNISKHFLQGIESDSFEDFPGEVYILGFLRNYADFLGLDAEQIVTHYRLNEVSERQAQEESPPRQMNEGAVASKAEVQEPQSAGSAPATETAEAPQIAQPNPPPVAESVQNADKKSINTEEPSLFPKVEEPENSTPPPSEQPKRTPRKKRKPKADASLQESEEQTKESTVIDLKKDNGLKNNAPDDDAQTPHLSSVSEAKKISLDEPKKPQKRKNTHPQMGRALLLVLVALVLIIAAVSILPKLKLPSRVSRVPQEYRAEGLPFEQRLYPQDKVYLPLGDDFISITLKSIKEKVTFETPYGSLTTELNEETVINPSADSARLTATVTDYATNEPQNGALVHFDVKEALSQSDSSGDLSVPANADQTAQETTQSGSPGSMSGVQAAPTALFRSSGPHPFYVNVSFMSPVLFRYEADKKEWVEKYYRKGESITINASNSITFWTANAQSVKVSVFQSAGKSTELVMGGPGEIAVQRLSWSNAQGGWTMIATPLD